MKLKDKTAIVTGSGRGIGQAIAQRFAEEGAAVVIAEINEEIGVRSAEELRKAGYPAWFCRTDVADRRSVDAMVEGALKEFGHVDILVNNAGGPNKASAIETTEAVWRKSIEVMQTGMLYCCQAAGQHMIRQRSGNIISISSVNAFVVLPERLAYDTAKAAMLAMTKVFAVEWCQYGIRVNAIAPWIVLTEGVKAAAKAGYGRVGEWDEVWPDLCPMHRYIEPREVANVALFLASDDSSAITGQTIIVDGGYLVYGWVPQFTKRAQITSP